MSTRQKRNTGFSKLVVPVVCAVLASYFLYHSQIGRYGSRSLSELEDKSIQLEFRLAAIRIEREKLENRVLLLKPGSIEKDMLDEQARYHLNLLQEDEITIFLN